MPIGIWICHSSDKGAGKESMSAAMLQGKKLKEKARKDQRSENVNQKNQMEVLIDGKIYKLSGAEEEMYLQKVAAYLNGKIGKLRDEEGFSRLSSDYQAVLLQLNIADDYFKEEERANRLENEKSELEKEIYSLKHELITTQLKMEKLEKEPLEKERPELSGQPEKIAEKQSRPKRERTTASQKRADTENRAMRL
jgi:Uncharacterized protein conserved in bacteria